MKLLDRLVAIWHAEQPGEALPDPTKGMERRRFLQILGGSVAVAVAAPYADLEALIWTPGSVVLAPEMGNVNVFLSAQFVAKEALRMLKKNLTVVNAFNRQYEASTFGPAKIGENGMTAQFSIDTSDMPRDLLPLKIARSDWIAPIAKYYETALTVKGIKTFGELALPPGAEEAARATDRETGLSVRACRAYSVRADRYVMQVDVLGGP